MNFVRLGLPASCALVIIVTGHDASSLGIYPTALTPFALLQARQHNTYVELCRRMFTAYLPQLIHQEARSLKKPERHVLARHVSRCVYVYLCICVDYALNKPESKFSPIVAD